MAPKRPKNLFLSQRYHPLNSISITDNKLQKNFFKLSNLYCLQIKCQLILFKITSSQNFDIFIMLFILLNMMTMAIEHFDQSAELENTLYWINQFFVTIFTLECVMKMISLRQYYFKQPWNVFDFVVVVSSVLSKHLCNESLLSEV